MARIENARKALPPPQGAINLADIERLAKTVLTKTAWAYYASAGDDEYSRRENSAAFTRFWFRPRVLNRVSSINTHTTLFGGLPSDILVFVSPSAQAKLGHPEGECEITRACGEEGVLQGVSANASCSLEEICEARQEGQLYQLYMNRNRAASQALI